MQRILNLSKFDTDSVLYTSLLDANNNNIIDFTEDIHEAELSIDGQFYGYLGGNLGFYEIGTSNDLWEEFEIVEPQQHQTIKYIGGKWVNVEYSISYNDLINTPTLSTASLTGSYNDVLNSPSYITSFSDIDNINFNGLEDGKTIVFRDSEWKLESIEVNSCDEFGNCDIEEAPNNSNDYLRKKDEWIVYNEDYTIEEVNTVIELGGYSFKGDIPTKPSKWAIIEVNGEKYAIPSMVIEEEKYNGDFSVLMGYIGEEDLGGGSIISKYGYMSEEMTQIVSHGSSQVGGVYPPTLFNKYVPLTISVSNEKMFIYIAIAPEEDIGNIELTWMGRTYSSLVDGLKTIHSHDDLGLSGNEFPQFTNGYSVVSFEIILNEAFDTTSLVMGSNYSGNLKINVPTSSKVSTNQLQSTISQLNSSIDNGYIRLEYYTTSSILSVTNAVSIGEGLILSVDNNEFVTQQQVDAARTNIINAVDSLEYKELDYTIVEYNPFTYCASEVTTFNKTWDGLETNKSYNNGSTVYTCEGTEITSLRIGGNRVDGILDYDIDTGWVVGEGYLYTVSGIPNEVVALSMKLENVESVFYRDNGGTLILGYFVTKDYNPSTIIFPESEKRWNDLELTVKELTIDNVSQFTFTATTIQETGNIGEPLLRAGVLNDGFSMFNQQQKGSISTTSEVENEETIFFQLRMDTRKLYFRSIATKIIENINEHISPEGLPDYGLLIEFDGISMIYGAPEEFEADIYPQEYVPVAGNHNVSVKIIKFDW